MQVRHFTAKGSGLKGICDPRKTSRPFQLLRTGYIFIFSFFLFVLLLQVLLSLNLQTNMATNPANLWSTPKDKQIIRRYHSTAKVNPQVFSLITPGLRLNLFSFQTVMSEHDTIHLLPRTERVITTIVNVLPAITRFIYTLCLWSQKD